MLIQDLHFIYRADDICDIEGGSSAEAIVYTSAYGGNAQAAAYARGKGLLSGALTGTTTNGTSTQYYRYSYGTGYGASYGVSYTAKPGLIDSDIKYAISHSISSDIDI